MATLLGRTIRGALAARGWSRIDLADRIGLTLDDVNDLIHGRAELSDELADRLADVFGVSQQFFRILNNNAEEE